MLDQEYDYYVVIKTAKGIYQQQLKDDCIADFRQNKKSCYNMMIENKVSADYVINKLINIENRLVFNEHRQDKNKKTLKKLRMKYIKKII